MVCAHQCDDRVQPHPLELNEATKRTTMFPSTLGHGQLPYLGGAGEQASPTTASPRTRPGENVTIEGPQRSRKAEIRSELQSGPGMISWSYLEAGTLGWSGKLVKTAVNVFSRLADRRSVGPTVTVHRVHAPRCRALRPSSPLV